MKQNNMLAMILAGGRGSRLHELTNKVAKPSSFIRRQIPHCRLPFEQLRQQRN